MQDSKRRALIWLRNDLRITDHYGFYNASKNCDRMIAYYSFDPKQFTPKRTFGLSIKPPFIPGRPQSCSCPLIF